MGTSEKPGGLGQGTGDRETRSGGLAVEIAARDLDRAYADRFGADAEARLVVDEDGVRGRDAEILKGFGSIPRVCNVWANAPATESLPRSRSV
jgi:hypothetical protein